MTASLSPSERSYIITGLSHPSSPSRLDGRTLLDSRPISISHGDAPQASGSARITFGATDVLAGIRLEVEDIVAETSAWRTKVEVDVSPQAFPHMTSQQLQLLSTQLTAILNDHFVPSIPPLPIVPPTKYFVPHLHLTLLSSSGNVLTALVLAARAAFMDLYIPVTRAITLEPAVPSDPAGAAGDGLDEQKDLSGIKAAVRAARLGKGKGRAAARGGDWELDPDEQVRLDGREERLPVLVTLNLVPGSSAVFLDATQQEESACPDRLHVFVNQSGRLCGVRMEGTTSLPVDRIRPLLEEARRIGLELIQGLNADIPR